MLVNELHHMGKDLDYIPVCHGMMRQTNDCSPVRVMQHKVIISRLYPCLP